MLPVDPHGLAFLLIAICVVAIIDAITEETNR